MNQEFVKNGTSGNGKSLLAGLIAGGLIGAGTMLLFAPQSGEKTRAELRKGADDLRKRTSDTMKDTVAQAKTRANQLKTEVQLKAGELERQGRDVIYHQLDRVSQAAEAGKKAVQNPQPVR